MKNLYLLTQNENNGYDTYDSCIVVSDTEENARLISPDPYRGFTYGGTWANSIDEVKAIKIGICNNPEYSIGDVILSSFNAG